MGNMKKSITAIILVAATFLGTLAAALPANHPTYATNELNKKGCDIATDKDQKAALGCDNDKTAPSVATNLINIAISVLALVAVVVIVFAGQRFLTAKGDPAQITQAKNMILYGVIGLIVAGLAFAIVNFIMTGVTTGSDSGDSGDEKDTYYSPPNN